LPGTVLTNGSVTNAKLASDTARASLLVNGGFEIWQRGTAFGANNAYTADRWQMLISGSDAFSVSKDTTHQDTGSTACAFLSFTLGTGAGATRVQQELKKADGHQIDGRTFTLSVRVNTSLANAVRVGLGSDGASGTTNYSAYHPGGSTYQTLSVTYTVPGDATDLIASILLSAGTTQAFYVDNAMLVVGSQYADYAPPHPADDLARCQRYYQRWAPGSANAYFVIGTAPSATTLYCLYYLRVPMAVAPTITQSAPGDFLLLNAGFSASWPATAALGFPTSPASPTAGPFLLSFGAATATFTPGAVGYLTSANANAAITFESNP
jgi:hypothetical protein